MKKILHISKYYYPFSGGVEQIARDCVLALNESYKQKIIAFSETSENEKCVVDGVEVIKCGVCAKISSQALSTKYGAAFHRLMAEFKPDIVIFHYPNPFVAYYLLKELKNRKDVKLVIYWHLDIIRQKFLRVFFQDQNKKLLERANVVVATSPNYIEGSEWLTSVREKCIVIPNSVNIDRMNISNEIINRANEIREKYKGKTICVAVGRHTEYKGFAYLIRASKYLDTSFQIFITGKGELTESLHKEAGNDEKIVFTGRIDDTELKSLILAADIFCFPSITKNEAFGVALAEAMYYEKPAVTFTILGSGVNYVCINGENGIEVDNRNVKQYADAMQRLADDPLLRFKYGKAAKKRVEENFLSTKFCENVKLMVDSL